MRIGVVGLEIDKCSVGTTVAVTRCDENVQRRIGANIDWIFNIQTYVHLLFLGVVKQIHKVRSIGNQVRVGSSTGASNQEESQPDVVLVVVCICFRIQIHIPNTRWNDSCTAIQIGYLDRKFNDRNIHRVIVGGRVRDRILR